MDGTKYEANANKNTFIWRKNTMRNRTKRWKQTLSCIQRINSFFHHANLQVRYSLLKEASIEYLLVIADRIEVCMKDHEISFVHGKGTRKSEIQRLYEEVKEHALKLWEYTLHLDMLGDRNSCSKTDPNATHLYAYEI